MFAYASLGPMLRSDLLHYGLSGKSLLMACTLVFSERSSAEKVTQTTTLPAIAYSFLFWQNAANPERLSVAESQQPPLRK